MNVANVPANEPQRVPHEVILASAGSGKTYALSNRYLGLVVAGVDPRRILASTFARAAAAEIRDRIVQRAAMAAADAKSRRDLGAALGVALDADAAGGLLAKLVESWGALNISTLDGVMARIVKAHALDLGLRPGLEMVEPAAEAALRAATLETLLEHDPDETRALFTELTAGTKQTRVAETIDRVVVEMIGLAHQATPDAWGYLRSRGASPVDLAEARTELVEAIDRLAHAADVSKSLLKAMDAHLQALDDEDWEQIVAKGIGAKIVAGAEDFAKKPIPDVALDAMAPIVHHACHELHEIVARRTRAAGEVIRRYSGHWRNRIADDGSLTFADLPVLVGELKVDAERLDERLGSRPEHLLLDEMQDTSVAQWEALRPLVHGAATTGGSVFAVGDVKQSIYGWRSGVPELLESIASELSIEEKTLTTTYRCRPAVIATVNQLFSTIGESTVVDELPPGPNGLRKFQGRFETHVAHRSEPSFAWVMSPNRGGKAPESSAERRSVVDDAVVAAVRRVVELAPKATVGILVRKNATVARFLHALGPGGADFDVAARGGTTLRDAPPVEVILSALRWAMRPDDTVAAFHVARSPLGAFLRLEKNDWNRRAQRRSRSAALRERICRDGLAATVRHLVEASMASANAREQRRLVALAEMASRGPAPIDDFIETVESQPVADESAASIQIMTIHQSKGLDFDVVILPELEGELIRTQGIAVAERRRPVDQRVDAIIRWVRDSQRAALPVEARDIFDEHRARMEYEAVCVLYVAMTRARHGLVAIVPPRVKGDRKLTPAAILRDRLRSGRDDDASPSSLGAANLDATTLHLETSDSGASRGVRADEDPLDAVDGVLRWLGGQVPTTGDLTAPPPELDPTLPTALRRAKRSPRSGVKPPSSGAGATLGAALGGRLAVRAEAVDSGTAWHAIFEQIEWLAEFEASGPDDAALIQLLQTRLPARDRAWLAARVAAARRALATPALRSLLTLDESRGVQRVFRERGFARRTEAGIQRGTIDRLVIVADPGAPDGGRPIAAHIIDYKTGDATAADAALADRYRPQLAAYATAVAEQFDIPVESVRSTLAFVEADRVIEVDGPGAIEARRGSGGSRA